MSCGHPHYLKQSNSLYSIIEESKGCQWSSTMAIRYPQTLQVRTTQLSSFNIYYIFFVKYHIPIIQNTGFANSDILV